MSHKIEKNQLDMLNLLRFSAFMIIFLLHAKLFMPVVWSEGVAAPWLIYTPAWAGVWIFFILSGYGIGCGFGEEKYELTINGTYKFYIGRLKKTVPLYYFYIIIVAAFIYPDILHPSKTNLKQLAALFFFNYQEEFLSLEFGLAWYMTTLMRLYLIAPFMALFMKRVFTTRKRITIGLVATIIIGWCMRAFMGNHITPLGGTWSVEIYKPFYFNIDLFFGGMLLSGYKKIGCRKPVNIIWKVLSVLSILLVIIYNSRIYYYGNVLGLPGYMSIYCYILPTVYLILVCSYVYIFEVNKQFVSIRPTLKNVLHNPLRVVDVIAKYQYAMYLFHASVLLSVFKGYTTERYMTYMNVLHIPAELHQFSIGCLFTVESFFITLMISVPIISLISARRYPFFDKLASIDVEKYALKMKQGITIVLAKLFPYKESGRNEK